MLLSHNSTIDPPKLLKLSDGVCFVKGSCCSCIYDLRSTIALLFHLDSEATNIMSNLLTGLGPVNLEDSDYEVLNNIISAGLASWSDYPGGIPDVHRSTEAIATDWISSAWIETTSRCQLNCIHCYGSFGSSNNNTTLTDGDIKLIAGQLSSNHFTHAQVLGGEPLIAKSTTKDLIDELIRCGIVNIEILTNGLLINESWVDYIQANNIRLAISVFGASHEAYQTICGTGMAFVQHQELFAVLQHHKIPFRVCYIRMRGNSEESITDVANQLGVPDDVIREDIVRLAGRAKENDLLTPSLRQRAYIKHNSFRRQILSRDIARNMRGHTCFAKRICITSSLDIYPCVMERSTSYGNLKIRELKDILRSSESLRFLTKDGIDGCSLCEYRYACFDCRANRGGCDVTSMPGLCTYQPSTGIWQKQPILGGDK